MRLDALQPGSLPRRPPAVRDEHFEAHDLGIVGAQDSMRDDGMLLEGGSPEHRRRSLRAIARPEVPSRIRGPHSREFR